jgi:DUF4097 and DUF4098 domain-containing protein YvlB
MKQWFIIASTLIVFGGLMFTLSSCASGWSFGGKREQKINTVTEDFHGIVIESDTADISILPSEDGSCKVVAYDIKKINYSVNVEDGILKIKLEDTRKWFEKIFNMGSGSLTVYLPESEYASLSISEDTGAIKVSDSFTFGKIDIDLSTGDTEIYADVTDALKISGSTGDIKVEDITCGSLSVAVSTGDVNLSGINCSGDVSVEVSTGDSKLSNVTCINFNADGDTGDLRMTNVIATGKFDIERETGDVKFNRCDASEIYVKTDTGDVTGTLLSEKIFITKTDTGNIRVPESFSGGKCKIETDTGDIKISIEQ